MTTGTYSGSTGSITNPGSTSFTITASGTVSGAYNPASVYANAADTLTNYGQVTNTAHAGVEFRNGTVINGSPSYTSAFIDGFTVGVKITGLSGGTITNYGTIQSTYRNPGAAGPFGYTSADSYHGFDGIYLTSGGRVTNSGTASDIYGWAGVYSPGTALGNTTITNQGTIAGYSTGIDLLNGSTGLTLNNSGLIRSQVNRAIYVYSGQVSITNTGTILAAGTVTEFLSPGNASNRYPGGIYMGYFVSAGANITNGSPTDSTALIQGSEFGIGVGQGTGVTITNWGTIAGVGGTFITPHVTQTSPPIAISFAYYASATDRVVDEVGSTFSGQVYGGGAASVLELGSASGIGTISSLGTQFVKFGTITVDSGAYWTLTGSFSGVLENAGTVASVSSADLFLNGTVINSGSLAAPFYIQTGGYLTNQSTGIITGSPTSSYGALVANNATVVNSGTIDNTGNVGAGAGVYLQGTSQVTNNSDGLIEGITGVGAIVGSDVTITNAGTLDGLGTAGYGVLLQGSGTIDNTGLITAAGTSGYGILIKSGGSVDNYASATISGGAVGISIGGSAGTVSNAGTIVGTSGYGVKLTAGGSVSNNLGLIEGNIGVYITGTLGTVTNSGTITGTGYGLEGVYLKAGGSVSNNGGLIQGSDGVLIASGIYILGSAAAGAVVNSGTILGTHNDGVELRTSGSVDNTSTAGLIEGYDSGVVIDGTASTVTNAGTILGTYTYGVYLGTGVVTNNGGLIEGYRSGVFILADPGAVTNSGTIAATGNSGLGVFLHRGGSLYNNAGLIEGWRGVEIFGSAGTVTNSGTIIGTASYGVDFAVDGSTLVNAGTIEGSVNSVRFAGSGNLVIVDPGAVFTGVVYGGTGSDTLELGSTASTGTLSGLYTKYIGFETITVDNGAQWALGGNNTIGTGVSLDNLGTLTITGTLYDLGTLTNTGSLGGAGTFIVDPATLFNSGSIGMTVTLSGGGYLYNEAGGTIAVTGVAVYGTGGAPTIVNAGTILGTSLPAIDLVAGGTVGNNGGLIRGYDGIDISNAAGTVTNTGTIDGTGAATAAVGILLGAGGSVANGTAGLVEGSYSGVDLNAFGTVTNAGTIDGTGASTLGVGAFLAAGGSVTDSATGLIEGSRGVVIITALGTVTNSGTIDGTGTSTAGVGVSLAAGGSVANNAGLIKGYTGLSISGTAGTVTNSGTIDGTGASTLGFGVLLNAGGSIDNTAGLIEGYTGAAVHNAAGTVTNAATIHATGVFADGVLLVKGGSIDNTAGLIEGYTGAGIYNAAGTVTNTGTIESTGTGSFAIGVVLGKGGSVDNEAGLIAGSRGIYIYNAAGTVTNAGTISGAGSSGVGILLKAGGTVVDSGTISGGNGTAVSFGGTGGNLLVLENGYSLTGGVSVAGTANTLELLGTAGAIAVDFDKAGAGFTNFGTVAFGAADGNNEILTISNTLALPGTISGFVAVHETIDLTGLLGGTIVGGGTLNGSDQLVVSNGVDTVMLQLATGEDYTGVLWHTSPDGGSGTDITATCFCRGTLILTDGGEVAVEDLAIGDLVVTLSGEAKPIRWIGRRAYNGRFVAGNRAVLPIRIAAGALGDGVPARDLWVSPEHALYLDSALVPAGLLVNGASIVQAEEVVEVEYFHIELAGHDVIFADGAPAESFVDDDSRGVFHNAAEFYALYPDAPARVPAAYCAPRLEEGFELEALRRRLLGRARRLGADGTAPPGVLRGCLELVDQARIDGWAIDPVSPDTPVNLVVLANGAEIGRVVADRYRRDLDEAGIGDGRHAFELVVPGGLAAGVRHEIEVRREADWHSLFGSPAVVEPVAVRFDRERPRSPAAASPPLGALRGSIDSCDGRLICGWAQDSADPGRRVGLLVKLDDQVIGRVLANRFRADLEADGIGDGRHAFELPVPNGLSPLEAHEIRIEREADGAELPGSPWTLPAANGFDAAIEQHLADIFTGAAAGPAEDRTLAFLTEQTDRLLARRAERHGRHAEREAHRLFRRRWGRQEANRSGSLSPPQLRALVVDRQVPCATRDAGSVALLSHVRALRGLGYEVSFAASDEMGNEAALAMLAAAEGIATCGGPHYSCLEDVLCRQAGTFDVVYLHRVENADRYLPLVRRYCPKARILYSVGDLHHLRVARQAQVEGRPELLAHSRYLAAIEMMAARRADLVITHSPVEAELLRREVGFGKVQIVPFAVPPRRPRRPFAERQGVAILGSFGHAPNPDAVHYLTRDILPRVWARDPRLICKIVGHGWHAGRLPELDPRIEMIGAVEDLDAVFDTVRLTVAPLRFGAGIKGKVLDSFAAGLPCVMTPIAAEGLALTGSLPQLVSDSPARLAELILHHHADPAVNEQAALEGARMVAGQFCPEHVIDALREVLDTASSNPAPDEYSLGDSAKMASVA